MKLNGKNEKKNTHDIRDFCILKTKIVCLPETEKNKIRILIKQKLDITHIYIR